MISCVRTVTLSNVQATVTCASLSRNIFHIWMTGKTTRRFYRMSLMNTTINRSVASHRFLFSVVVAFYISTLHTHTMRYNVILSCFVAFWALNVIPTMCSTDSSPDAFICWLQDFNLGPQGAWRERLRQREPLHRTFSDLFYASSEHRPARATSPLLIQRPRAAKEATSVFQCSECEKSFSRGSALHQHERDH